MTKKTGEQMLIELGYVKKEDCYNIEFSKRNTIININRLEKSYCKFYKGMIIGQNVKLHMSHITHAEHKAIHQCLLDFGWIKEEV